MRPVSLMRSTLSIVAILVLLIAPLSWGSSDKHQDVEHQTRQSVDDSIILAIFDQFNTYDIELATMALEKGEKETIRSLARMIVMDHPKLQQQGRALAARLGISYTVPTRNHYANEHQRHLAELHSMSGKDFDTTYLHYEIQFSQKVVHAMKHELIPSAQEKELKHFLNESLSKLEIHVSHMMHAAGQVSETHTGNGHHESSQ